MPALALRLDIDGSLSELTLPTKGGTLRTLQAGVGGTVDVVRVGNGLDMWLHDEGVFVHEVNKFATTIAWELLGGGTQAFYGPVVFTGVDDEGDTIGLSRHDEKYLRAIVADILARIARR